MGKAIFEIVLKGKGEGIGNKVYTEIVTANDFHRDNQRHIGKYKDIVRNLVPKHWFNSKMNMKPAYGLQLKR